MTPEIIIGLIAVFVSGGALGAAGTLLGQWVLKKVNGAEPVRAIGSGDVDLLRGDVTELSRKLQQVDVRLDFTEQLLGGALPLSRPILDPDPEIEAQSSSSDSVNETESDPASVHDDRPQHGDG